MAPRKRIQPRIPEAAEALDDSVKKPRTSTRTANSGSRKRERLTDVNWTESSSRVGQVKSKKHRWGRVVGRLAGLMEMPMDILFEIFGHLRPLDVLRLARTTKQFRRVLMHRSALSIWITARQNVPDLPHCPPYMSEPQFTNLVFDTHCHECLAPNIRSVDWRIGRRICSKCAKECMVDDYSVFGGESVYKAVPSKYGKRGRPCYYSKDLREFQEKRASFTDPEERERFISERQALVIQMEKHGALLEAWATNQAKDRSEQLDDLRRERKEAIIEKLTELGWGPEIQQIPYRDDLGHHRLVKQATRLTPRIWANIQAEMINYMQQMKAQRLDRERKALIISRKRIAVSILRAYKISHLPMTDVMPEPMDFCAMPQVLEILELPTDVQVTGDTFAPVVANMDALIGDWRNRILGILVQKVKDSLYPKSGVTSAANSASTDNKSSLSSTDPSGKGKAKAIDPLAPDDAQIIQDLSLATTVFNCKCCNPRFGAFHGLYGADLSSDSDSEDDMFDPFGLGITITHRPRKVRSNPLFFPKVMGHRCLTKQRGFNWDNPTGDPTKQYDYPIGSRSPWSCLPLQLDVKAGKVVAKIVNACGLDPKTTTVAEMDQLDPQLACLACLKWSDEVMDEAEASVFGWRAAVAHNIRNHAGRANAEWKLIDEELESKVVDVDQEIIASHSIIQALVLQASIPDSIDFAPPEEAAWLCAHCLDLPNERECVELSRVKAHLNDVHSISDPQENQDYYQDYEAPQGRKTHIPQLKITLFMDRPDHVPAPGEKCFYDDPWCCGFSDEFDEFEDDYYDGFF